MFQDDFKRNKETNVDFFFPPTTTGQGFFSDLFANITKDTVKSTTEAAGKATMEGVMDGTKKTLSRGVKKAGKKMTEKIIGEGVPPLGVGSDVPNLDEITCHAKKVIEGCEKEEKLTKIEEELLNFFKNNQ